MLTVILRATVSVVQNLWVQMPSITNITPVTLMMSLERIKKLKQKKK
jgi:hypothetical protein